MQQQQYSLLIPVMRRREDTLKRGLPKPLQKVQERWDECEGKGNGWGEFMAMHLLL